MKRFLVGIMAVMVVLSGSAAFADDAKVSLGVKGWVNSWERTFASGSSVESDSSILMIGPSLNIKFDGGLFMGASYLASSSDYEFTSGTVVDKISRNDLDLLAGVMFNPMFGMFVGYKSISADVTTEDFGFVISEGTIDYSGPGFGILGNIPLGESVALYGSLSWMLMTYEEDFGFGVYEEDAPGASLELGLAAAFSPNLSGSVGIKSQSFVGVDSEVQDTFVGLTFGMNLTF